jgi:hypothetical protein
MMVRNPVHMLNATLKVGTTPIQRSYIEPSRDHFDIKEVQALWVSTSKMANRQRGHCQYGPENSNGDETHAR